LLHITQEIETLVGRTKTEKWGPRVIDIDILFYGDNILDEEHLKVPHPFIQDRRFTLVPLFEIAANFEHPILKKTMKELLDTCKDVSEVKRLKSRG
jgi:2-amino-4-hydroxy-6-hydroxymethyldihydropteridine diphosphokinase